ncbi:1-(5-phosphoribosyl)-5-[(5-phosphoribosylamino)me thylideneamino]imidazole-4-carboxamide isomerase [Bacillota bacterium]
MIILPAIDILKGECVRLTQGIFDTSERVAESWIETARAFREEGAEWVHMVDLDGAREGGPVNSNIFIDVAEKTGLKVELGGGIRTLSDMEYYLDKGISRIVLGSVAVDKPELVREAVNKYGDKIAVGIDAKKGLVKTAGWIKESRSNYIETAKRMEQSGVEVIIYTDIGRDGMLSGPNLVHLEELSKAVSTKIIASGGIRDTQDIADLKSLGLYGAICGKSIYHGTLKLKRALEIAKEGE